MQHTNSAQTLNIPTGSLKIGYAGVSTEDQTLDVATCIHKHSDLQSARFSTGINCVYPAPRTGINCE
ncbi:hypothetical protein C9I49_22185 [Pseudomonas prosekii]|uniref:Uncharacterized protein n=1 Tax=Pseudomonas prosekii TaxID=1148509 RepID=A0A2U2D342_9PSED|nr:hypothetical protein C9I49_22185 [Pseudomonas prosekii]